MIFYTLLICIYIWPFGQLLSISNSSLPFTIYPLDISILLLTLSLVFSKDIKVIFSHSITKPLFIFLALATVSILVNFKSLIDSPSSILYLLRLITYPSIFFASKLIGIKRLKKPIIITLVIFALLSLLQYFIFPDMRYLKHLGFDDHYYRLIGTTYDPNYTGAILSGISLYLIGNSKIIASTPFIGLLAMTVSRASYLGFVSGIIYFLKTQKKTWLFVAIVFLGVVVYLIPKPFGEGVNLLRTFSIFSRLDSWQNGLSLFVERPLFGWGYNTLRGIDGSRFQIDNSFIMLMATTGLFGALSFFYLLNKMAKGLKNTGVKALLLSIFVHSMFNNTLLFIWVMSLSWLALSLDQESS